MQIKTKLILTSVSLTCLIALTMLSSWYLIEFSNKGAKITSSLKQQELNLQKIVWGINETIVMQGAGEAKEEVERSFESFSEISEDYDTLIGNQNLLNEINTNISPIWKQFKDEVQSLLKMEDLASDNYDALARYIDLKDTSEQMISQFAKLQKIISKDFLERKERISKIVFFINFGVLMTLVVALYRLYSSIVNPISLMTDTITKITTDLKFSYRVKVDKDNEIGTALKTFNHLIGLFEKTFIEVNDVIEAMSNEIFTKYIESNMGGDFLVLKRNINSSVDKLANAFNERNIAMRSANEASKAKSVFLANMSHEIRTPINAILGYAQILKHEPKLSNEVKDSLDVIYKSGDHLLCLVNNILDISKIESGNTELSKEKFNLHSMIIDIERLFLIKCRENKIKYNTELINFDPNNCYLGDKNKLQQVFINLVGNSVKFTDNGNVTLKVRFEKDIKESDTSHSLYFEVSDSGMGISKEALTKIFRPFQQDKAGETKGGTGLGLAIAKQHVEMMGGDLKVNSEPNEGTTFYFSLTFPFAKCNKNEYVLEEQVVDSLKDDIEVSALIVDDIDTNRTVLSKTLSRIGVKTFEAKSGKDSIKLAKEIRPDIIFMDYKMPEMNGVDAILKIREDFGDTIKYVIISASILELHDKLQEELREKVDFIRKPFLENDIFKGLKKLLNVDFNYKGIKETISNVEELEIDLIDISVSTEMLQNLIEAATASAFTKLEDILQELAKSGEQEKIQSQKLKAMI